MKVAAPLPLEDLRRAIDSVDDGLLDLLVRRSELVAEVGRGKSGAGAAIYRPAREAQIMRRLFARLSDPGERDRILRIWRVLMAASYERQGGLRLVAEPAAEWQAVGHFSPRIRPGAEAPAAAVRRVRAGEADVAVVLAPVPSGPCPWFDEIVRARSAGEAVFVLGRLPYLAVAGVDTPEALVIGRGHPDPSGDDVVLVAAAKAQPARGAVGVWSGETAGGLSLFAYGEYVRPDDSRLAGAVWLGSYPRPLDPSGPRAVEFGLRP